MRILNKMHCHHNCKRLLEIIILSVLIFWGLFVRLDDIYDWKTRPEVTFHEQDPLIATGDGYYYLGLTKDIVDGNYNPIDEKRAVPDNIPRPFPPPLLSLLTAAIYWTTPFSLSWIAVVMPAILGILTAIPLYGLGRFWGGSIMGLSAVIVGLVSNSYVARSCLGKYDTDCLNVTFTMAIVYCFLKFGTERGRKSYKFFIYGLVIYGLFFWWWDQAPYVVSAISLFPLLVALIFFYRPPVRERKIFFSILGVFCLLFFFWQGLDLPAKIINYAYAQYNYILNISVNDFPSTGMIISEQGNMSPARFVERAVNSSFVFLLAITGILWLFWKRPKESLFLIVPIALASLSFVAERFMIFIAPVVALGVGFFLARLWKYLQAYKPLLLVVPCLLVYISWGCYKGGASFASPFLPESIAGMELIQDQTPGNAVVWSFCDNGYPINYWGGRATVCDGQTHDGERSVYNTIPLATADPRLAANFIRFYVARGTTGFNHFYNVIGNDRARGLEIIKAVLAAGPQVAHSVLEQYELPVTGEFRSTDDWLAFFFPDSLRPVYLFIDWGQILSSEWITWLGTWDIIKKDGDKFLPEKLFREVSTTGLTITNHSGTMRADLNEGKVVLYNKDTVPLSSATVRTSGNRIKYEFGYRPVRIGEREGTYTLDVFEPQGFALLVNRETSEFILNKLFWLRTLPSPEYFRPVIINTPDYQLWEVGGDKIER